jgi:hypothetical protein
LLQFDKLWKGIEMRKLTTLVRQRKKRENCMECL